MHCNSVTSHSRQLSVELQKVGRLQDRPLSAIRVPNAFGPLYKEEKNAVWYSHNVIFSMEILLSWTKFHNGDYSQRPCPLNKGFPN